MNTILNQEFEEFLAFSYPGNISAQQKSDLRDCFFAGGIVVVDEILLQPNPKVAIGKATAIIEELQEHRKDIEKRLGV